MKPISLSVVTTIYRTADCIEEFHARSVAAAAALGADLETVFVNDGSPDNGLEIAERLAARDPRVVVVDLSRNYGQHKALWTGMLLASGDLVAVLDGDLEEDPAWLVAFDRIRRDRGADVVYGVTEASKGTWVYRLCRGAFYRALDSVTEQRFPRNIATARLMTRRYIEALRQFSEREVVPIGLWSITGFAQIGEPVRKLDRDRTSYTGARLISLFVRALTSFSILPLMLVFAMGMLLSVGAVVYIGYLIFKKFVLGVGVEGWTSVMALQLLIGGLLLFFNGIIAIYVGTIFLEVKQRPRTIVRHITRGAGDGRSPEMAASTSSAAGDTHTSLHV
jgi:putative glycosyltransferase